MEEWSNGGMDGMDMTAWTWPWTGWTRRHPGGTLGSLQMNSGFLDKLIERLGRVRPEDVQGYLLRLSDEKGFLETIFNAIHEGVIVTDLKGRINYLNRAACELFGLERKKCMGEPLDRPACAGLDWNKLVEAEKVVSRDMEVFYPQHRFLNFYVVPLSLHQPGTKRGQGGRAGDGGIRGDPAGHHRDAPLHGGDDSKRKAHRPHAARRRSGA